MALREKIEIIVKSLSAMVMNIHPER